MYKELIDKLIKECNDFKNAYFYWNKLTPRRKWTFFQQIEDLSGRVIGLNVVTTTTLSPIWFLLAIVIFIYVFYTIIYSILNDRN